MEEKTCFLEINSTGSEKGLFYIKDGKLYDAVYSGLNGEEAAFKLLALDKASIRLNNLSDDKVVKRINISLMNLIMKSLRRKDESQKSGEDMIAPLSIVLKQQGEDVKIIYIGNRHESTLVARKDLNVTQLSDLSGKTLAVPMRYSGHNLSILQLMEENGLTGKINIVEMNPPDMASALISGALDAYYVGEPFAAQTLRSGDASLVHYVENVWKYFICNLVLVRQDFIENNPEIVQMLVQGAARSGIWAGKNPQKAARIASEYWNQPMDIVEYALTAPKKRIVYDQFAPKREEMQHMADLMVRFNQIEHNDISDLIEDSFAKAADLNGIIDIASILQPGKKMAARQGDIKPNTLQ